MNTALERYGRSRGVAMNYFIQDALPDRLEGPEDVEDLKQIRHEPTRRLSELLTELDLNGAFFRLVRSISEGSRRRCPTEAASALRAIAGLPGLSSEIMEATVNEYRS